MIWETIAGTPCIYNASNSRSIFKTTRNLSVLCSIIHHFLICTFLTANPLLFSKRRRLINQSHKEVLSSFLKASQSPDGILNKTNKPTFGKSPLIWRQNIWSDVQKARISFFSPPWKGRNVGILSFGRCLGWQWEIEATWITRGKCVTSRYWSCSERQSHHSV